MAEDEKVDGESFEFPPTDLALVVEGRRLYVNMAVIKHHSPVFKTMLEGNYMEKDASEIELPGKSFEDVKEMLRIIYPNMKHPLTKENVLQIFPLAHEYQMSELKDRCEKLLIGLVNVKNNYNYYNNVSSSTLIEYMCLAEKYGLEEILSFCIYNAAHVKLSSLTSEKNKDNYSLLSQDTRLSIAEHRVKLFEEKIKSYDMPSELKRV